MWQQRLRVMYPAYEISMNKAIYSYICREKSVTLEHESGQQWPSHAQLQMHAVYLSCVTPTFTDYICIRLKFNETCYKVGYRRISAFTLYEACL